MEPTKLLQRIPLFRECREADLARLAGICEAEVHR